MNTRLEALTSIRGLAAWWIVFFHFQQGFPNVGGIFIHVISRGYLAVDFFFVLSGFVIALSYMEVLSNPSAAATLRFFRARFARVYPLHITILGLFLSVPIAIMWFSHSKDLGQDFSISYLLMSLALIQNWGLSHTLGWNVPAWSISAEFGAYIVFPTLVPMISRLVLTRVHAAATAVVLLLLLLTSYQMVGAESLGNDIPERGLYRCILEFTIGTLCYKFWSFGGIGSKRAVSCYLAFAIVGVITCELFRLKDYIFYPTAFAVFVCGLADKDNVISRLLSWRLFQFLGNISYSTYLIHYIIKYYVKFLTESSQQNSIALAAYLGMTLLLSIIFFYTIESPCRKWFRPTSH